MEKHTQISDTYSLSVSVHYRPAQEAEIEIMLWPRPPRSAPPPAIKKEPRFVSGRHDQQDHEGRQHAKLLRVYLSPG